RPRAAQCGRRCDQPRPRSGLQRQPHCSASRQRHAPTGPQARHCHGVHRRRAGRCHASGVGVMTVSGKVWRVLERRNMELGPKGEPARTLTHWRYTKDGEGIVWLIFDRAGQSTNTLSEEVLVELNLVLEDLKGLNAKGLVIRSAKKSGFAAGADIRDFRGVTNASEIESRLARGHELLDRLANLSIPTVAVIHGHCLGGGLELALACRHRIAVSGASLGFPEVLLGLHPGLGGTFRLTSLIDPVEAMT